jgi:hypothetical protein
VPIRLRMHDTASGHTTPLGVATAILLQTEIAKAHAGIEATYVMLVLPPALIWVD